MEKGKTSKIKAAFTKASKEILVSQSQFPFLYFENCGFKLWIKSRVCFRLDSPHVSVITSTFTEENLTYQTKFAFLQALICY